MKENVIAIIIGIVVFSPIILLIYGGIKYMSINEDFRKIVCVALIIAGVIIGLFVLSLLLIILVIKKIFHN